MLQQGNTIVHCTSTPLMENFRIGDVLMSFKGLADGFRSVFGFYLLVLAGIRIHPFGVGSDLFFTEHSDPVWGQKWKFFGNNLVAVVDQVVASESYCTV